MNLNLLLVLPLVAAAPVQAFAPAPFVVDAVDELIKNGRAKLDKGDTVGALELFNRADAETKGALRARMWVLRARFEQAQQIFDAFDEVDELAAQNEGPDLDYLYGIGSYFKAKKFLADGVTDASVGFAFKDAQQFLQSAVDADGDKYYDAWYPLADAAWMNQDPGAAGPAIERAAEVRPSDPGVKFLQGRVAFSLYTNKKAEDEKAAAKLLKASIRHLKSTLDLIGENKRHAPMIGAVHKQLGIALQWNEDEEGALAAYAASIAWDPNGFEYGSYWGSLGLDKIILLMEQGARQYSDIFGANNSGDATLLWWLGNAYNAKGEWKLCEETYLKCVQKWPAYSDSWFYIGMARYKAEDYDGAIDAWHENWKANANGLVASIQSNQQLHLDILTYVIGKCAEKGQPPGREGAYNVKAAWLSEVRCAVDGDNWEFWDNWGLFARDGGAFLWSRNSKPEDRETAAALYDQAWAAYQAAMKLAADKPHLMNDAAVILHYYLERDYDLAIELYEKSHALAAKQLAAGGLSEADKALAELAHRDSKNNLAALRKKIKEGK